MTKRKAAPAALNTTGPAPTLPQRIRYFVGQLMQVAAQPGPDGEVDLELGGLAVALDMVAGQAERELASLDAQLKFALSVPWDDERVVAAARKHHGRATAAEAAVDRVRAQCADWAKPTTSATRDGRIRDEVAATCADIILRALDGPSPTPDDSAPLLEQTCATFSDHGWGRCVEPDGHEGNHAYRSPSKPTDGSPA